MNNKCNAGYIAGLLTIGLGIVGYFDYWWPGTLFAIGGAILLGKIIEQRTLNLRDDDTRGGLIVLGVAILAYLNKTPFPTNSRFGLVLTALGLFMIVTVYLKQRRSHETL